jgi:hypothetical protein
MFKFTIRELLLVTLVVALGVGWWLRERQWYTTAAATADQMKALECVFFREGMSVEWSRDRELLTVFHPDDPSASEHALYVPGFATPTNSHRESR